MSKNGMGKTRKSGAGKLFLGIFLGFILCLGLIAGVLWYAYNNVSIKWINKTFNTDIDISEEVNKKTIKELAESAISAMNKIDTYSLNDMKNDFGFSFGDSLMGIDISDLKDVPIKDIADKAQDKVSNISADELKDAVDLSDMDIILNKTNTYYVYGDKLYTDETHHTEVNKDEIPYTLSSASVEICGQTRNILDGKVEIELRYLPLTKSLGDFMGTMGDKITVGELVDKENGFGVELPEYLYDTQEKKNKTINELSDVVDNLYLAEFLGYTISGSIVTKDGAEVTGIVAKLAKKTIKNLNDEGVDSIINDSTIAEILGYYEDNSGKYYQDKEMTQEVTGIMGAIAGSKVENLSSDIKKLKLIKILDYTADDPDDGFYKYKDANGNTVTGILTLIDLGNTTIENLSDNIINALKSENAATLYKLQEIGIIDDGIELTTSISSLGSSKYEGECLGDLKINEAINLLIDLLDGTVSH